MASKTAAANSGDHGNRQHATHPAPGSRKGTSKAAVSPEQVLQNAKDMVPRLRARTAETNSLRRLPDETLQEAIDGGLVSLLLPKSLGGSGGGLRDFVELIRTLSHGHISVAWTLAFFAEHNAMLARFPAETQSVVFPDGEGTLTTALIHIPRLARKVEGGYEVTGHWGYGTGISHAKWVQLLAVVFDQDAEGPPKPMVFIVPRDEIEVIDTWQMSGMQGTGSHDVNLEQYFVPSHMAIDFELWASRQSPGSKIHPETSYSYALADLLSFMFPAMAVGAAEAVLEEYRSTLNSRVVPFSTQKLADTVGGQARYARAVAAFQAAEATLEHSIQLTLEANEAGDEELSPDLRGRITLNLVTIMQLAAQSIELAARGSGSSIYKTSSYVQVAMRDLDIVRSHLALDEDTVFSKTGQLLLGRLPGGIGGGEVIRPA